MSELYLILKNKVADVHRYRCPSISGLVFNGVIFEFLCYAIYFLKARSTSSQLYVVTFLFLFHPV